MTKEIDMSNATVLQTIVDEYVAADAAEKAAAAKKAELKKVLMETGLNEICGTHAKLKLSVSERLTLDPQVVRSYLGAAKFLEVVSVSTEKARKFIPDAAINECVMKIDHVSTLRISALVTV